MAGNVQKNDSLRFDLACQLKSFCKSFAICDCIGKCISVKRIEECISRFVKDSCQSAGAFDNARASVAHAFDEACPRFGSANNMSDIDVFRFACKANAAAFSSGGVDMPLMHQPLGGFGDMMCRYPITLRDLAGGDQPPVSNRKEHENSQAIVRECRDLHIAFMSDAN